MNAFKTRLLIYLLALGLISGALIGGLLYYVFPAFFPSWFFEIIAFFLLIEAIIINLIENSSRRDSAKKMLNMYMLAKVVKMLTSLFFVTIYALAVKDNIKNFVLIFMTFYLVFTGIETFLFSKIERHIKEKNNSI